MSYPILLASNDQTMHKIMNHTFMESLFKLDAVSNVREMERELAAHSYDIILLDFRLSESEDGYQLAKRIRVRANHSSIIMLFDSCDPPDSAQLKESRVCESIVRPFTGEQLIDTCETVLQSAPSADSSGSWQVEREPKSRALPPVSEGQLGGQNGSPEMPPIIGQGAPDDQNDASGIEIPPIISEALPSHPPHPEQVSHEEVPDKIESTDGKIPSGKELEYPDVAAKKRSSQKKMGVRLIPIEELNLLNNSETDSDTTRSLGQTSTTIELNENEINETMETIIEQTIEKETSPENLWSVKRAVRKNKKVNVDDTKIARDIVLNSMVEKLKPLIEKNVYQYCEKIVEKIAWEVIPGLAEDIIKKEVKDIKDSVIK